MAENLKTTRYNDGSIIPLITDNTLWGTTGTNGAPGATGAQGPQGIQGPTGPSGGVTSVTAGANIVVDPVIGLGDVTVSAPDAIVNTGDTFTSTPKVREIISLTSAEYAALQVINTTTLYVII